MNNKNNIPGTNPEWGRNLPDGDYNSLVDSNGENYDNGVNFDERDNGDVDILTEMPSFEEHLLDLQEKQSEPETVNLADVKEALFNDIKNTNDPLDREYKLAILSILPNIDKRTDIIEMDKLHSYKDELSFGDKVNREMKSEELNKEFSIGPYTFGKIPKWDDEKNTDSKYFVHTNDYYKRASERVMAREIQSRNRDKEFDDWSNDDKVEIALLSLLPHYEHNIDAIILDYVKEGRSTFSQTTAKINPEDPYVKLKYGSGATSNFLKGCKNFCKYYENMDKRITGDSYVRFRKALLSGKDEYEKREDNGSEEYWYEYADLVNKS